MRKRCILVATIFLMSSAGLRAENDDVVRSLIISTKDNDSTIRKKAFQSLAKTGIDSDSIRRACQLGVKDDDVEVRMAAIKTLSKLVKDPEFKAITLIEALNDAEEASEEGASQFARQQLKRIGEPAVPHLIFALAVEDKKVAALNALKQLGGKAESAAPKVAAPKVAALMKDDDAEVRAAAIRCLGRLGSTAKEAVPTLIKMLSDMDTDVRLAAIRVLNRIGPESKDAVPRLLEMLKQDDFEVRVAIIKCLGSMSDANQPPEGIKKQHWKYAMAMMRQLDANKDGVLSGQEVTDLEGQAEDFDTDKDGKITRAELVVGMGMGRQLRQVEVFDAFP